MCGCDVRTGSGWKCLYWKSRNECGVWQSLMSSLWQLHLPHYRCKPYPASHIVTWHMRWGGDAWSVDDWCRLYPVSHSFIRLLTFTFLSHSVQHLESSQDFHHLHNWPGRFRCEGLSCPASSCVMRGEMRGEATIAHSSDLGPGSTHTRPVYRA